MAVTLQMMSASLWEVSLCPLHSITASCRLSFTLISFHSPLSLNIAPYTTQSVKSATLEVLLRIEWLAKQLRTLNFIILEFGPAHPSLQILRLVLSSSSLKCLCRQLYSTRQIFSLPSWNLVGSLQPAQLFFCIQDRTSPRPHKETGHSLKLVSINLLIFMFSFLSPSTASDVM